MTANEQLSFEESNGDTLRKSHQIKRIEFITSSLGYIGLTNQKIFLAENQLQQLRKRLKLSPQTMDTITNEVLGINIFNEGLQEVKLEDFPIENHNLFIQEEFFKARDYVSRALEYNKRSSEKRDDGCFYCLQVNQARCILPTYPPKMKNFIFRTDFASKDARKGLLDQFKADPDTVCCQK